VHVSRGEGRVVGQDEEAALAFDEALEELRGTG